MAFYPVSSRDYEPLPLPSGSTRYSYSVAIALFPLSRRHNVTIPRINLNRRAPSWPFKEYGWYMKIK